MAEREKRGKPGEQQIGEELFYRSTVTGGLAAWELCIGESNISVYSEREEKEQALVFLKKCRDEISAFAQQAPDFLTSLTPIEKPCSRRAAPLVWDMLEAGKLADTGPMAAVAGVIAEHLATFLARKQRNVIVENGGDIFLYSERSRVCAIYAGSSPFSMKIGIKIAADQMPCALCTSSGTVGPSLSFGKADATVVLAPGGAAADALTTSLSNMIKEPGDLKPSVEAIASRRDTMGAVAVMGDKLAVQGAVTLVEL